MNRIQSTYLSVSQVVLLFWMLLAAQDAGVDLLFSGMPGMSATERVLQHLRREGGRAFAARNCIFGKN